MLLLGVLQDALAAEHVTILHAVELDLLLGMGLAVLDLALGHLAGAQGRVRCRGHGQASEHLVVHWQVVRVDLVARLVVGALDHAMLGQLTDALRTERVTTGQRSRLLLIVIVRLEADATLKDGVVNHSPFCCCC